MAVYSGWFLFAVGLGPTPGGLIASWFGLQAPFIAFAALSLVAAAICWWWLPETRGLSGGRPLTAPLGHLLGHLARAASPAQRPPSRW